MIHDEEEITKKNFIDYELILFSQADNERSIPNALDGLNLAEKSSVHVF
jgi:hypothetical protein